MTQITDSPKVGDFIQIATAGYVPIVTVFGDGRLRANFGNASVIFIDDYVAAGGVIYRKEVASNG